MPLSSLYFLDVYDLITEGTTEKVLEHIMPPASMYNKNGCFPEPEKNTITQSDR
jgi:hypothetical protein